MISALFLQLFLQAQPHKPPAIPASVHMATGVKVGEVSGSSAVVWVRLTKTAEAHAGGTPWLDEAEEVPDGLTLADMQGAAPGTPGEVLVRWRKEGEADPAGASPWTPVDPERDFTAQFHLEEGVEPGARYLVDILGRAPGGEEERLLEQARFRTPPPADRAHVLRPRRRRGLPREVSEPTPAWRRGARESERGEGMRSSAATTVSTGRTAAAAARISDGTGARGVAELSLGSPTAPRPRVPRTQPSPARATPS